MVGRDNNEEEESGGDEQEEEEEIEEEPEGQLNLIIFFLWILKGIYCLSKCLNASLCLHTYMCLELIMGPVVLTVYIQTLH